MPVIRLNDTTDSRLRVYSGMTDAQLRDGVGAPGPDADMNGGLFIAESAKVIERAIDAGVTLHSIFLEEHWLEATLPIIERIESTGSSAPVLVATHEQFREVTGYQTTRGALAAFRRPALPSVEDALANARRVAVLEDITNYTNVGAAFRSAAALGIDAVLITPACHDPLYRRAARVSMGTVFQVPWTRIGDSRDWAAEGVPLLHSLGFKTAALALSDNSIPLDAPELAACEKLAMVLGTEGDGLSPRTIASCDYTVKIPMEHGVDSLNVAAASAVAFWELRARKPVMLHIENPA
ncbi:rRNA methyltransferase [Slackia equolifaciens]|uniref:rRNA methyltransferase n=1 Tax=Slackia equolifaciens TaxID=498718 RepID=A0A3N0B4Q3_9ACTN|nr:RNA methyltransferase [Slackia equolifaciens]RNL41948.1 rRNA methyltransferase [Slackia equolifaciens]